MAIAVTTLIENSLSDHKSLVCEHGLSFHIRTPQTSFLFDCGASGRLADNAEKLGVDLGALDFVACSHGHYDHAGGFRTVAARSRVGRLITGEGFFTPKYAREGIRHAFLGVDFDAAFLRERDIAHEVCGDLMRLDDYCWLVGNFERTVPGEIIPSKLVLGKGDDFVPDLFADEICLAVRFREGVAVLVGCSHPGIVNMVGTVRRRLGLPVLGVWGGTHLSGADPARVSAAVEGLIGMGVGYFGLSHCSGDTMLEYVGRNAKITGCRLRTGDGLYL